MKLRLVTPDEVKINPRGEYNVSIWKQTVDRYAKYDAKFYQSDEKAYNEDDFFAVYIADGIRFIKRLEFSSSLDCYDLRLVRILPDGTLDKLDAYYPKTQEGRRLMRNMTKISLNVIFQ